MMQFYLMTSGSQMIAGQDAIFTVKNTGASSVAIHGYVTDSFTGWEKGAFWPLTTGATDLGTYGTPGVGDKTIAMDRMVDHGKLRTDMSVEGKSFVMIEAGDEKGTSYMLMPEEKRAIKQSR